MLKAVHDLALEGIAAGKEPVDSTTLFACGWYREPTNSDCA